MSDCGLYVHVPFCETKCGYCDFYSVALKERPTSPLVDGLLAELRTSLARWSPRIRTVFVGGGTPTVLPTRDLAVLFDGLADALSGHPVVEFTVEANPATVDEEKLDILTRAGVDRVSMGAQSWHSAELAVLERRHVPGDIERGVALIGRHGIRRINLDLIFGIGGQTMESWSRSLDAAVGLGVAHLSCYALTYEPGTRLTAQLHSGRITPCDEDLETEMYLFAIDRLRRDGYEQYEISSFAQPGERCLHNLGYWRNEEYIGVGPSAGGFIGGLRYKNVPEVNAYTRRSRSDGEAVCESERVTGAALAGELVMMQLRLVEGLNIDRFIEQTGSDPREALAVGLEKYLPAGLVETSGRFLRLTPRGRLVADTIIADFYAELHAGGSC